MISRTEIAALEQRQRAIEKEIDEALHNAAIDDPFVANLKERMLYIREEIARLREEVQRSYH